MTLDRQFIKLCYQFAACHALCEILEDSNEGAVLLSLAQSLQTFVQGVVDSASFREAWLGFAVTKRTRSSSSAVCQSVNLLGLADRPVWGCC